MEGFDPTSPYRRSDYRRQPNYGMDTPGRVNEQPRPASARDIGYGDMYDSGIHAHSGSPHIPQPYGDTLRGSLGIDNRAGSLDRREDLYGITRGSFNTVSERLAKEAGRQSYTLKSLSSNPGLSRVLGANGPQQRRAQSYEMNLEKQGLADYHSLLAEAGVGGNPAVYGNPTTQLIEYGGLTTPALSTLGGLNYVIPVQRPIYPTLPAAGGVYNMPPVSDAAVLQRECLRLQHELMLVREKLNACTTSIRTFWSPELKRERSMRKEENAKYAILADHLHQLQLEKQTMLETLHNMEADLRREQDYRIRGRFSAEHGSEGLSELDLAKRQIESLTLENRQLTKAVEDADRRTANVKASLTATEESLRRLIEAVKAGKAAAGTTAVPATNEAGSTVTVAEVSSASHIRVDRIESDRQEITRLRNQLSEALNRGSEAEKQLIERDYEYSRLKEEFNLLLQDHRQLKQENDAIRQDTRQTQTLQSLVDTKESKIMTLENEIRLLEDEITRLRDDGLVTPNTSTSSGIDDLDRTLQAFRSNERLLKSKVEMLTGEISKRDCEIYTLQSRLEMTDKQHQDQTHHINVLKEQLKTKEHKIGMLTADTEDFRKRLKEKESQLEKKTKGASATQAAKRQLEGELTELKDQLDIKERKLSLLQRKIENLEDLLNEKEVQLAASKAKLSRIGAERSGVEDHLIGQEEIVMEKEKQLERLRSMQQRVGGDHSDELDSQKRLIADLRNRIETLQKETDERTNQVLELREELSQLRTNRFKYETEISQLQAQINQRASEVSTLQMEKQLQHKQITAECEMKYAHRIGELESQVNHYMENNSKLQSEVDRLSRSLDSEKFAYEKQLHDIQEELHETQNNLSSLKRSQQTERKKQTQQLEETRQREENARSDIEILKSIMSEKDSRIRELEQALRESVRLTAEREIYASGRDDESRQLEQQVRELRSNVEQLQRERNSLSAQLANMQEELSDREGQLKTLEQECFQNYLPELEKLRRANHEANLRVAAMVKLAQGREHTLTEQDRVALSGIPMFPNIAPTGSWTNMGPSAVGSRLYAPGYHSASGGATSPHLAGSAFQLIGNSTLGMGAVTSGRASVPGQSIASADVLMLTRMLQEKDNALQHNLQELTHLRFQNSEQEIRMKALQRELDAKTTRLGVLEATQYTLSGRLDAGTRTPTGLSLDVSQLRKANQELTLKVAQLQLDLDDRERQIRAVERMHTSIGSRHENEFSEMAVLRRELATTKAERETEVASLASQLDKINQEKTEVCTELQELRISFAEKSKQLRAAEAERDKEAADRDNIQKKYEAVLTQLSEKREKLQSLEVDCQKTHIEELKRQMAELEDLRHHTTYLQNTIKERENRIEIVEKESFKLRDEISNVRRQLSSSAAELKSLREESAYREERIKQMQAQQSEEIARLRSMNQEQVARNTHLEMKLEEKEHELKTKASEIRCQMDEITRLQSSLEDVNNRLNISQKRTEEREARLRKLENENHDLLDEIHCLRKGNTELESQVDNLRQRLLDKQDGTSSTLVSAPVMPISSRAYQSTYDGASTVVNQELERVRKQHADLTHTYEQTLKQLEELQIQYDQMTLQRNSLRSQLDEEIEKRAKLEEQLRSNEDRWKARVSQAENLDNSKQVFKELTDLRNELERKQAQITCLNKELEQIHSSSSGIERSSVNTSQQLLIADLQVRLRQMTDERDHAKEQLTDALARVESTYLDSQQQLVIEKQTLQERLANLTQTAQNATSEAERYQREVRQASARVQQLSRQLQETQNNCDAIARQRDNLHEQLDQLKRTMGRSGAGAGSAFATLFGMSSSGTFGTSGGMRPASAGPGSYENTSLFTTGGSTSQLSRELDRIHREYEALQSQMKEVQEAKDASEREAEKLREELVKIREEVDNKETQLREMQDITDTMKQDMEKRRHEDEEQAQIQQNETMQKLNRAQQQLNEQANQIQQTVSQLNNARQRSSELEQTVKELTQRLQSAETQAQYQRNELENYHQTRSECTSLRNELRSKEAEIQQITMQYDQLTREYENLQRNMEQMTIELSTAHAQAQQQRDLSAAESHAQASRETNEEALQILKQEIKETSAAKHQIEAELAKLQAALHATRSQLDEKVQEIAALESSRIKQHEEIRNLQRELQATHAQLEDLGGPVEADSSTRRPSLKAEIDNLKREILKRDDTISAMERDCQEKHLRRLEALQAQLRRFEEEAANMNKVLDEQRAGLEERDQVIRQLRSQQGQVSSVTFEKLRNEHSRCKEQIDQQAKRIETLARQIESQSDELLAIKLEALTASLCEKEANIALMELTAPKNAASEKSLNKLRAERDELQIQQRQLANTRAMLEEEKKSRR